MKAFIGLVGILLSLVIGWVTCYAQAPHPPPAPPAAHVLHETLLAKGILALLKQHHLRAQPVNDDTATVAFDLFLSKLDPQKLYLTQSDVEALRRQAHSIDDELRAGQFKLAHEAGALRRQRAALVATWIQSLLARPFDLTRSESVELSGKKRAFAQNEAEHRDLWRRLLKRDALVLMRQERQAVTGKSDGQRAAKATSRAVPAAATTPASTDAAAPAATGAALEAHTRKKLMKRYKARFERVAKEDRDDDVERFINAFAQVYDPHTVYLPPHRKENLDIRISGSLEGIGAALRNEDGIIRVQRIVPGSASWRQGQLKAEDAILAVAQDGEEPVDVVEARLRDIVRLIRGKKGTVVRLTVRKPDGEVMVIPITRDVVWLEAGYAKAALIELEELDGRFAYIDVPKFYGDIRGRRDVAASRRVSSDIRLALIKLKAKGIRGLVIDVRGNSGGLLTEASHLTGLFIKKGPVVQMRNAEGKQKVLRDRDSTVVFDGPLVILVDRFSASAAEIITSALQDYGRAVLVGSTTFGKGTVQHLYDLNRIISSPPKLPSQLGSLKITRYQFYGIDGDSIQLRGVTPDIELPDTAGHLQAGERESEHAIPWDTIEPLSYTRWSERWDVQHLRRRSQQRQANHAVFNQLSTRTVRLKQLRDDTLENLEETVWRQQQEQREAEIEALKLDEKVRFIVHPVAYTPDDNTPEEARVARVKQWVEKVEDDPWIEEAVRIANDMSMP